MIYSSAEKQKEETVHWLVDCSLPSLLILLSLWLNQSPSHLHCLLDVWSWCFSLSSQAALQLGLPFSPLGHWNRSLTGIFTVGWLIPFSCLLAWHWVSLFVLYVRVTASTAPILHPPCIHIVAMWLQFSLLKSGLALWLPLGNRIWQQWEHVTF